MRTWGNYQVLPWSGTAVAQPILQAERGELWENGEMLARSEWPRDYAEQWWSAYPRKVSKKLALKCLDRVRKSGEVPFEVLLSATLAYARSRIGKDMQFTKHPTTWLNQGCWDDDGAALLDGKVLAPSLPCANGGVLIRRGSPQAKAWQQYRGRDFPWGPSGVWMVASEWPPVCGND